MIAGAEALTSDGQNPRRSGGVATVLLVYAFAVIMAGTTLPTPMYALYATTMGFTVLTSTMIYAAYAGGVLAALVIFGRWSDAIGRRPVLLGGVVAAVASGAMFLLARHGARSGGCTRAVRAVGRCLHRHRHRSDHRSRTAEMAHQGRRDRDHRQRGWAGRRAPAGRCSRRILSRTAAPGLRDAHRAGGGGRPCRHRRARNINQDRISRDAAAATSCPSAVPRSPSRRSGRSRDLRAWGCSPRWHRHSFPP